MEEEEEEEEESWSILNARLVGWLHHSDPGIDPNEFWLLARQLARAVLGGCHVRDERRREAPVSVVRLWHSQAADRWLP